LAAYQVSLVEPWFVFIQNYYHFGKRQSSRNIYDHAKQACYLPFQKGTRVFTIPTSAKIWKFHNNRQGFWLANYNLGTVM